jgi:putative ABC transport system substrate-binding protein
VHAKTRSIRGLEDKADDLDLNLIPKKSSTVNRISKAFEYFTKRKVRGVVVAADSFFNNNRKEVIDAAKDNRLPTIYQWQEFVQAGGLISYGPSILEAYQKAGEYVNSILFDNKKPGQMPCSSPSQYYLVMNYNAAKDLGIKPPSQLMGIDVELVYEAARPAVKRRPRP